VSILPRKISADNSLLAIAHDFISQGRSVIPLGDTQTCGERWRCYGRKRITHEKFDRFYQRRGQDFRGLGLLCGTVSAGEGRRLVARRFTTASYERWRSDNPLLALTAPAIQEPDHITVLVEAKCEFESRVTFSDGQLLVTGEDYVAIPPTINRSWLVQGVPPVVNLVESGLLNDYQATPIPRLEEFKALSLRLLTLGYSFAPVRCAKAGALEWIPYRKRKPSPRRFWRASSVMA
jgi:hypothetical protein